MTDHALGSLLGRWHQWRRAYSHERGYARAGVYFYGSDEDDALEGLTMHAIDEAIESLTRNHQLALQHVARAECMGVEVLMSPQLPANRDARESLVQQAMAELHRKLVAAGVL